MITAIIYLLLSASSFQSEVKSAAFIDSEGRSGTVTGTFSNENIVRLEFISETETGSYQEYYTFLDEELKEVAVVEISFNRPKFWNEKVAKSNGDSEWYDPEKNSQTKRVYYFDKGEYSHWTDSDGSSGYPVNRKLRNEGEAFQDKASEFIKLLQK